MAEGVSDIVQRLRDRAYSGKGVDTLCEDAAAEIDRLRREPCPHVTGRTTRYCTLNLATAEEFHSEIARLQTEIARLRLTDAELKAVRTAAFAYAQSDDDPECAETAARLLAIAERMGGER